MQHQSEKRGIDIGREILELDPLSGSGTLSDRRQHSLSSRADDVLVSVAVLGLAASVSDGDPDQREIRQFIRSFQRQFILSRNEAVRVIGVALKRMRVRQPERAISCACETLNEYLNLGQKMKLYEGLADILIADGSVHVNEEYYLDYIALKLNLVDALKERLLLEERGVLRGNA